MQQLQLNDEFSDRTLLFPVRSNVHYFDSAAAQLSLVDRIKQTSILFDRLVFQAGLYQASFWDEHKSSDMHVPVEETDIGALEAEDAKHKPSGNESVLLIDGVAFGSGPTVRSYRCQFESILNKYSLLEYDWISKEYLELFQQDKELAAKLGRDDESTVRKAVPETVSGVVRKVAANLNRDLLLANRMGTAVSIDPVFNSVLLKKSNSDRDDTGRSGVSALGIVIPDWSGLEWEELQEVRNMPSTIEFRRRIAYIERTARERVEANNAKDFEEEVLRLFNDDLTGELIARRSSFRGVARDTLLDFVLGFIPGASTVVTAVRGALNLKTEGQAWSATLFRLRG